MKLPKVDLSRWDVRGLEVLIDHMVGDEVRVRVVLRGMDVSAREREAVVVGMNHYSFKVFMAHPERHIREALERAVMHELDECLYVNGQRVCKDPHPEATARAAREADETKTVASGPKRS